MKSGRGMKGQLVLEFVVAAILLFGVIIYVTGNVMTNVDIHSSDSVQNALVTKAFMISDLMLKDGGVWSGGTPLEVGISDNWPVLSTEKMQDLGSYCASDYQPLLDKFGLAPGNGAAILINETEGGELMRCGNTNINVTYAKVTRFAVTESGDVAKVEVWVW